MLPSRNVEAGSSAHLGTPRGRLRSQALGPEAGGAWWQQRQEASHRGHSQKAGGVAASPVGERRSVPTLAQQQSSYSCGSRVNQKRQKQQNQNRSRKRK